MHLLRVLPPQIFFSPRSERMLMRQLHYNPLFRWFVSLEIDEVAWNHAVFSKNREWLLNGATAREFLPRVPEQARPHLSTDHFTSFSTAFLNHSPYLQSVAARQSAMCPELEVN